MSERWVKLRDQPEFSGLREDRKPPHWLFVRTYKRKTSFRVDYRKDGAHLQTVIRGEVKTWKEAAKLGERMIHADKFGHKQVAPDLIRCVDIAKAIVESKRTKAPATFEQAEIFFRVHIVPFLDIHCPFARSLKPEVWEHYKRFKRQVNPKTALFNHWKFMNMLRKRAHEMGLIPAFKFDFDENSEDSRSEGLIISDEDLVKMLNAADQDWHDRIILGRRSGMRPGEPRCLQVDRVDFSGEIINLKACDTKTREPRSFIIEVDEVWEVLSRRAKKAAEIGTLYFFPSRTNPLKPIGGSTKGWKAMLRRAGVNPEYDPNDLRHTFITEMIRKGIPLSDIADYVGNSVREIERTYKHMRVDDTRRIAQAALQPLIACETASSPLPVEFCLLPVISTVQDGKVA